MQIEKTLMITHTPEKIANAFCDMDSEEQALFFNFVANITSKWNSRFYLQLEHMSNEEVLSDEARRLMQLIGEYGPKEYN